MKKSSNGCLTIGIFLAAIYLSIQFVKLIGNALSSPLTPFYLFYLLLIGVAIYLIILLVKRLKNGGYKELPCLIGQHTWGQWDYVNQTSCFKKETCPYCGATRGELREEHEWKWAYQSPEACTMQETCSHCYQTRGDLKIIHNWEEKFTGPNSNQKQKVCSRCQLLGEKWITQANWSWIFTNSPIRQKYIELQNSVKGLFFGEKVFAFDQQNTLINEVVEIQQFLPQTNFQIYGLRAGKYELFIYPDKYLCQKSGINFTSGDLKDLKFSSTNLPAYGQVPKDAKIVGRTWLHTCLDGSPDLRYKNNPSVPLVQYATLLISINLYEQLTIFFSYALSLSEFSKKLTQYLTSYPGSRYENSTKNESRAQNENRNKREYKRKAKTGTGHQSKQEKQEPQNVNSPLTIAKACTILEIQPDSSLDEIKAAFRKQAMQNHPDRVSGLAEEFKELAEKRMKEINAAYEFLLKIKA